VHGNGHAPIWNSGGRSDSSTDCNRWLDARRDDGWAKRTASAFAAGSRPKKQFSRIALAVLPMCHPYLIRLRKQMRHDADNALKDQGNWGGLTGVTTKLDGMCSFQPFVGLSRSMCWGLMEAKWPIP
jgi:hypothetical protein